MDIDRKVVKRSWNQGTVGLKAWRGGKIALGGYRSARNSGPLDPTDKTTTGNKKEVAEASDYIKYKRQYAAHKTWKGQKGVIVGQDENFKVITDLRVIAEHMSLAVNATGTLYALEENGWTSVKSGSSRDLKTFSGETATAVSDSNGEMSFKNVKIPSDTVIKIEVEGGVSSTLGEVGGDIVRPSDNAFADDTTSQKVKRLISSDDIGSEKIVVNNITDVVAEVAENSKSNTLKSSFSDESSSKKSLKENGKTSKEAVSECEKIVADTMDIEQSKINLSTRDDAENTGDTLQKSKEIKFVVDTTTVIDGSYNSYGYNTKENLTTISNNVKQGFADAIMDNSGSKFTVSGGGGANDFDVSKVVEKVFENEGDDAKEEKTNTIKTVYEEANIEDIKSSIDTNSSTEAKNASRVDEYESYNTSILNAKAQIKKSRQDGVDISGVDGLKIVDGSLNNIMSNKKSEFEYLRRKPKYQTSGVDPDVYKNTFDISGNSLTLKRGNDAEKVITKDIGLFKGEFMIDISNTKYIGVSQNENIWLEGGKPYDNSGTEKNPSIGKVKRFYDNTGSGHLKLKLRVFGDFDTASIAIMESKNTPPKYFGGENILKFTYKDKNKFERAGSGSDSAIDLVGDVDSRPEKIKQGSDLTKKSERVTPDASDPTKSNQISTIGETASASITTASDSNGDVVMSFTTNGLPNYDTKKASVNNETIIIKRNRGTVRDLNSLDPAQPTFADVGIIGRPIDQSPNQHWSGATSLQELIKLDILSIEALDKSPSGADKSYTGKYRVNVLGFNDPTFVPVDQSDKLTLIDGTTLGNQLRFEPPADKTDYLASGHTQPEGNVSVYHYHGWPWTDNSTYANIVIGYANDGFPIMGRGTEIYENSGGGTSASAISGYDASGEYRTSIIGIGSNETQISDGSFVGILHIDFSHNVPAGGLDTTNNCRYLDEFNMGYVKLDGEIQLAYVCTEDYPYTLHTIDTVALVSSGGGGNSSGGGRRRT